MSDKRFEMFCDFLNSYLILEINVLLFSYHSSALSIEQFNLALCSQTDYFVDSRKPMFIDSFN